MRLLDLFRLLHRGRQQHGPARQRPIPTTPAPTLKWAFSWPANRRILYNRASADLNGKPWDPSRKLIEWDGEKWAGYDVPDIAPTAKPDVVGPFIMNPEGTARLFAAGMMRDGPFPVHYEPFEVAGRQRRSRRRSGAIRRRACSRATWSSSATPKEFPYAATSYRLTEHFHYWTKHVQVNAVAAAGILRRDLASNSRRRKASQNGGWVRVWSKRGSVKAKAVVTKRIKPLICDGKTGAHRRHPAALGLHRRGAGRASGRTR